LQAQLQPTSVIKVNQEGQRQIAAQADQQKVDFSAMFNRRQSNPEAFHSEPRLVKIADITLPD
jgi:hypothetical protein